MLTTLIVDDETNARMALRGILEEKFSDIVSVIGECKNVPEAVRFINTQKPQIVFLDIEMPEYNGFDLLSFFQPEQVTFQIIFVTAYNEYALQAFEVSAVDYILKPVRAEHIERALQKVEHLIAKPMAYKILQENLQEDFPKKIVLQNAENIFIVKIADILYLEAEGSYTKFVIENSSEILISKKISDFDFLENHLHFFRSHRSFYVNLEKIKRVDKKDFTIEMENGKMVSLAQDRKKGLLERIHP